jgi:AAA ATPase containing von Willebrand factor type A (vWA) domain
MAKYDFSGYATRNNIRCSDGRTIRRNAFIDNDGATVPLVWNHRHNEPSNVLGHALLENRDDGVYCYGSFNDTAEGQRAKSLVTHGDIKHMSIYANQLRQTPDGSVMHGNIREVSLVLAGANPGAYIETLDIQHADDPDYDEEYDGIIFTDLNLELAHASKDEDTEKKEKPDLKEIKIVAEEEDLTKADDEPKKEEKAETSEEKDDTDADEPDEEDEDNKLKHADESKKEDSNMANSEKTVQDVFNELTEEQKNVVYFMIGEALKAKGGSDEAKHSDDDYDEEDTLMHTNVFEDQKKSEFLAHAEAFFSEESTANIFKDAKRLGSLKDAVLEHAAANNIVDENGDPAIDWLFPDAKTLENTPEWINIKQEFVTEFMSRVKKSPFSRVKTIFADITEAEARAKGYTKGNKKIDEVFKLLKRTTTPTTVYKKQTIDRDDVIDITDFDVIAWLKAEMRVKLDEELVRAFLVGDGRSDIAPDKISETNIRPIWTDDDLFTIKAKIGVPSDADDDVIGKAVIRGAIKARKDYRGSGNPILFTTEDALTNMLLLTDSTGRDLYDTPEKLATKLRVSKIVTTEIMENLTRTVATQGGGSETRTLYGIIVNPTDYNVGADKGGQVALFDDFDIDYNQMKYLIETRCSGALVKPYSAIALEVVVNPT